MSLNGHEHRHRDEVPNDNGPDDREAHRPETPHPEIGGNPDVPYNKSEINEMLRWANRATAKREPRDTPLFDNLDLFDAKYIESRGPYRFKPTDRLNNHLIITRNKEILIYTDHRSAKFREYLAQHDEIVLDWINPEERRNVRDSLLLLLESLETLNLIFFFKTV
jgi:hypothetical protein